MGINDHSRNCIGINLLWPLNNWLQDAKRKKKARLLNERLQGLIYQDQNIKKLAWLILAKVIKSDSNVWYPGGRSGYLWK